MDSVEKPGPGSDRVMTDASSSNAPAIVIKSPNAVIRPKVSKGVENAKKRLRAFSIQKKTPIAPVIVPKPVSTGNTTILIGKLSSVKPPTTPKVDDEKKLPKPPKPGTNRKSFQDSYIDLQKRTLAEIEDMKRKMELVELGIPLGLICPTSTSEKAMPTKAMPPIKHFLDAAKVDEIIREAKQAKDEGKKYKFDYQKLLPKYDNPFQRKKEENKHTNSEGRSKNDFDRDKRSSDKYDSRRSLSFKREDRDRYKYKERGRDKSRSRDRDYEQEADKKGSDKEADVDLKDYLVCDNWSLDNEDKISPKRENQNARPLTTKTNAANQTVKAVTEQVRDSALKNKDKIKEYTRDSPMRPVKIEKLQPVIDSFKFEIDPNDDEIIDIFDVDSGLEKYARKTKAHSLYSPTDSKFIDYDQEISKDASLDDTNEHNFLESIINEIKQEDINEDISQDKGLVEYDMSPVKEVTGGSRDTKRRVSITPELDDKMRDVQHQRSDFSESYRSNESGYKTSDTIESGGKSVDSFRLSIEKELDEAMASEMSKATVDSLETWSFVLKICQPLLFRHDKNKCYRETRASPKLWYAENPKLCNCVKDRSVVYNELQMCKMNLVDRVYGCDQIPDASSPNSRNWYPRPHLCLLETHTVPVSTEWEGEDMGQSDNLRRNDKDEPRRRSHTPVRNEAVLLDREYQRFMKAVWPEVTETRTETRSTTPVRQESRKKKKDVEVEKEIEMKKPAKKVKLTSEGWSQESDLDEEVEKSKKMKEKLRKRKRSSSLTSDSEPEAKKKKKSLKKKALKKTKSKSAKTRRIGKRILRKLKEKEKKKRKQSKIETIDDSDDDDNNTDKNTSTKSKKKRQQKLKKKNLKRKKKEESSSSSSSTSTTDSSTDECEKKANKAKKAEAKKKKEKKRKRKSTSDSAQSEELFDVNILKNIKTERLTDDEKSKSLMDFSPRRHQKPREIINVKELQNDFVGNNIHIKKEAIESRKRDASRSENVSRKEVVREREDLIHTEDAAPKEDAGREEDANQNEYASLKATRGETCINITELVEEKEIEINESQESTAINDITSQSPTKSQISTLITEIPIPISQIPSPITLISPQNSQSPTPIPQIPAPIPQTIPITEQTTNVEMIPTMSSIAPSTTLTTATTSQIKPVMDESNMSLCSSQESVCSVKQYEKDDSHLRPSSQNSNYSFNDVINASQSGHYMKQIESGIECEEKFDESYQQDNYEMYEQLAMAYQSDVATLRASPLSPSGEQRIETVVRSRSRGEIKCDWRAGHSPALMTPSARPSRWGLKPVEVNIVLTGGNDCSTEPPTQQLQPGPLPQPQPLPYSQQPQRKPQNQTLPSPQPVYKIQSLGKRTDSGIANGYDEAYMDMYGAADRLQYGDCFSESVDTNADSYAALAADNMETSFPDQEERVSTLDARIDHALKNTVLGEVAKEVESPPEPEKEIPEKGILIMSVTNETARGAKRVSFADGYKPGQDSDVEEPPIKKKRKIRRVGCAWPCPASHPDHVALWDALPPPPPPPGSPPPPRRAAPPLHLLRAPPRPHFPPAPHGPNALNIPIPLPPRLHKLDPTGAMPVFIPSEPPPTLVRFP